ncbi:hypothetical protein CC2G_006384 [Coprinopsis cinerea AmutBmut pab1-1]|nr:hypothetical protein CC2G_006384 [Coprinopsis cinerea AmutBmut pab1-1]
MHLDYDYQPTVAAAVVPTIETSIFASRHTPIFASLTLLRTFKFRIATADLFDWFNRPATGTRTAIKEHCRFMVEILTGSSKSRSSSSNSLPGTTTTTTTTDEGTTTNTDESEGPPARPSALSSVPNLALLQLDLFGSQTVDDFVSLDMEWERVRKVLMEGGGGGGGVFGKLEKVEIRACVKWELPWRTRSSSNSNSAPGSDRRPRDLTDEALTAWMKEGPFAGLEEKRGVCVEVRNVSWKEEYYPYVSNP